jgi:hypothetical protein
MYRIKRYIYLCLLNVDIAADCGHLRRVAGVAQLVERKALNLVVEGSSPSSGGLKRRTLNQRKIRSFCFDLLPTFGLR